MKIHSLTALMTCALLTACFNDEQDTATQEQAQPEPIATQTTQTTPTPTEPTPTTTTASWLTKFPVYYKTPDPDGSLALAILKEGLEANADFSHHVSMDYGYGYDYEIEKLSTKQHVTMLAMWASHILIEHPQYTKQWCEQLKSYNSNIVHAIYKMANTSQSKKCLHNGQHINYQKLSKVHSTKSHLNIWTPQTAPPVNWAGFYATGNPKYVHEILGFLADYKNPKIYESYNPHAYIAIATGLHTHVKRDSSIKKIADEYIENLPKDNQEKFKHYATFYPYKEHAQPRYRGETTLRNNTKILAQLPPEQKLAILTQ